jgi:hypothetical protein
MPRTRTINREEAIPSGESNSIGENGTGYSEAWAQSSAWPGRLRLLRLHADIKLQVIDVMVQCLGGSLRRELEKQFDVKEAKDMNSRQSPHPHSIPGTLYTLTANS